jgi:hypothetical protein
LAVDQWWSLNDSFLLFLCSIWAIFLRLGTVLSVYSFAIEVSPRR